MKMANSQCPRSVAGFGTAATAWMIVLLIGGVLLRVAELHRSYWSDELATLTQVSQPSIAAMIEAIRGDVHPPLYNLLVYGWVRLFGYSEVVTRSLSLLFGVAAIFTPLLARASLSPLEKLLSKVPLP
jgi:predicted membrane-bound mannosyltransferase